MTDQDNSFEAALLAFEAKQKTPSRRALRVGEKIEGTLLSIGDETAFLEIGAKAEGQVPVAELRDEDGALLYEVGDSIEALITAEGADGVFSLRVRPGQGPIAGDELRDAQRHGIPVEGRVVAINKGGAEVEVGGLRAFCPISQLADRYVEDPTEFLERRLQFRVTRFEEGGPGRRPNVVLSRRALLEEEKQKLAVETRAKLEVGAVLNGQVTSIASYGAFIDLGGLEGLLHVSEMAHHRVEDPNELLSVGQKLEVEVLKIEPDPKRPDSERISLSIRSLQQDPWPQLARNLPIGETVAGKVTRVETFGAFVELSPGIEGLVHVSELGAPDRVRHAREVVSPGQEVQVRVLDIDHDKRRIALSIGAATAAATASEEAEDKAAFEERSASRSGGAGKFGSMADILTKAQQKPHNKPD